MKRILVNFLHYGIDTHFLFGISLILSLGFGCVSVDVTRPPPFPFPRYHRDDTFYKQTPLIIENFTVFDDDTPLEEDESLALKFMFAQYIEKNSSYSPILLDEGEKLELSPEKIQDYQAYRIEVFLKIEHAHIRTYLLDALFFYPGIGVFQPITPFWGKVWLDAYIIIRDREGKQIGTLTYNDNDEFSLFFYSWYRQNQAFRSSVRKLYSEIFQKISKDLDHQIQQKSFQQDIATLKQIGEEKNIHLKDVIPLPSGDNNQTTLSIPPEAMEHYNPFVQNNIEPNPGFLKNYLHYLSGVELSRFYARANVTSYAKDMYGKNITIASGNEEGNGYRVYLAQPAKASGFFIYPLIGFVSEDISIQDFRSEIPEVDVGKSSENIPAIVFDPQTGMAVDPMDPNVYQLRLKTFSLGQKAGYDYVSRDRWSIAFASGYFGVNLIEDRFCEFTLGSQTESGWQWVFVKSFMFGASYGLVFPKIHFGFRLSFDIEKYPKFQYPTPLDFKGEVLFVGDENNPDSFHAQRNLTWVEAVDLQTYNGQLSLYFFF